MVTSILFLCRKKATLLSLACLTVLCIAGHSQENRIRLTPAIIPPSPTASELGRYGLIQVGYATGTINPEVPLYAFKTKNLTLPVSLSYNSNGIKVDEVASWVGMHWSLNAGGVVSRIVRDDADHTYGPDIPYPPDFQSNNPLALAYIENAGNSQVDTEPDLFAFNFLGYTGKFVFDRNGEVVCIPHSDLRIQRTVMSGPGNFVITTPDGIKCTFEAAESTTLQVSYDASFAPAITAWYLTRIEHPLGDVINLTYANNSYTYYLSYSQTIAKNTMPNSCTVRDGEDQVTTTYCPSEISNFSLSSLYITGKRLAKIESAGYGTIDFHSTKDRTDVSDYKLNGFTVKDYRGKVLKEVSLAYVFSTGPTFTGPIDYSEEIKHRMFLKKVTEKDGAGGTIRNHEFEYDNINALPARLSYAQDHWGYFNGVNNYSSFPVNLEEKNHLGEPAFLGIGGDREMHAEFTGKGMLNKITWPTGGTSTFVYGPHTYYTQKAINPNPTHQSLFCSGREGPLPVVKTMHIINPANQTIHLHASSQLLPGYSSTQAGATFSVTDAAGNPVTGGSIPLGQTTSVYVQLQANVEYIFTLTATTNGDDENNTSNFLFFDYYATAPVIVFDNVPTGGMRINEVVNYEPDNNSTERIKYYYARHDELTKSSGRISGSPEYVTKYFMRQPCGIRCATWDCNYVALHTDNTTSLFPTSNNIYYQYVTIGRGESMEGGAEEHEFSISFDNPGIRMWGGDYIKDAPLSNTSWDNGKEKDIRFFANNNGALTLIKYINNTWIRDPRYHKEVPALTVRKKWDPWCRQDAVYQCDASNINLVYKYYTCTASHTHQWWLGLFSSETKCIASGNRNEWVPFRWHPCYGKQPGETAVLPYALDYLDALEYRNISDWIYLDKTTETTWDENGQNPVVNEKDYIYDNDQHLQLSRVITNTSEGKTVVASTKYPPDYEATGNDIVSSLLNKHIINAPVKRETIVEGNLVSAEAVAYNLKGQAEDIYYYESAIPKPPATHDATTFIPSADYKLKKSFEFDPSSGNVNKVQAPNDLSTLYLWGYKNTLPIAEVKNADNGITYGEYETPYSASAEISVSSPETAMWPSFEVFSSQNISPLLYILPNGGPAPSSPLLMVILKRSDGSWVNSWNASWGENNLGSISLTPGSYQWYYASGDIVFDENFRTESFSITYNYIGRHAAYNVFHTSFEEDGHIDSSSKTGRNVWSGAYNVALPGIIGNYKLTYWKKGGGNPWTLVEENVTVNTNVVQPRTIGGPEWDIDEVRLYPIGAQMTTFTYDPLVGMTSSTDANNVTVKFSYDAFGRLSTIVDDTGNVLKSYVYHYKGQFQD